MHECRHTFASLLIDTGANPKAVQEVMGHSKIQTTFDIYGHLLPGSHTMCAPGWMLPRAEFRWDWRTDWRTRRDFSFRVESSSS